MARISVFEGRAHEPADGYVVASCALDGSARSRWLSPEGYSLWLAEAEVGPGSVLSWGAAHGDEVVHVGSGRLLVADRECPAGGIVVVERGAVVDTVAPEGATVLHFGSSLEHAGEADGGPRRGGGVHVIGPEGVVAHEEPTRVSRIYADGTCATCSVHMLLSSRTTRYRSAAHSHTQDELIHLLEGEISLGSHHLRPGDSLCIPADTRYRFESGEDGYRFLNFSAARSGYVPAPGAVSSAAAEARMAPTGARSEYFRTAPL